MKVKLPNIVTILVLTTLTAVTWISFSIYRAITVEPTPNVSSQVSEPLNPVLDQGAIDEIKSRQFVSLEEISNAVIISTPTPLPTSAPTEAPVASIEPSSSPSTTPTPTGGTTP